MNGHTNKAVFMFLCLMFASLLFPCKMAFAYPEAPHIEEAQAAIVCDDEGNVLWEMNPDARLAMASTTKVMTAVCALDMKPDLDTVHTLVATPEIWYSTLAGFVDGDTCSMGDLIKVLLVYSANDAAINIGVILCGSEEAFVEKMNEKARELGLNNTHFENTHGLEGKKHYSSARDLVKLGKYALENYPLIADICQMDEVSITVSGTEKSFKTTNYLKSAYHGIVGIKTGWVDAGISFLGAYDYRGLRLYTCVLCCSTSMGRWNDSIALIEWASGFYAQYHLSDESWLIRSAHFKDNFMYDVAVRPQSTNYVSLKPEHGAMTYITTLASASVCGCNEVLGHTQWSQADTHLFTSSYLSAHTLSKYPSINPFAIELFSSPRGETEDV